MVLRAVLAILGAGFLAIAVLELRDDRALCKSSIRAYHVGDLIVRPVAGIDVDETDDDVEVSRTNRKCQPFDGPVRVRSLVLRPEGFADTQLDDEIRYAFPQLLIRHGELPPPLPETEQIVSPAPGYLAYDGGWRTKFRGGGIEQGQFDSVSCILGETEFAGRYIGESCLASVQITPGAFLSAHFRTARHPIEDVTKTYQLTLGAVSRTSVNAVSSASDPDAPIVTRP